MGKPRLIIIIRHAQSEGNRDKTVHQTTPDHRVPLTAEGHQQALEAGEKLRALLRNDDTLHFFISPYRRTRETTEGILTGLCANDPVPSPFQRSHIKVYEEPRLREQDFGNFQPGSEEVERLWRERASYGHFFYRIPNGESGADVYDRVSSFNGSLWRRFSEDTMASVAILVTHGLCSRVFLMAWYHYSVEFFEDLRNVNHCEFLVMKLAPNGRYVLQNSLRRWSDLRKERAARKNSVSAATSPPSNVEPIPVRRWCSQRLAHDSTGGSFLPRPTRKNTADLFKDEPEIREEAQEKAPVPTTTKDRRGSNAASRERSRTRVRSSSNLPTSPGSSLGKSLGNSSSRGNNLSSERGRKPSVSTGLKSYLGRDGGGSRSGCASPFGSDDDTNSDSPAGPVDFQRGSVDSKNGKQFSSSLARALRGDFDDGNEVLADALGDMSVAGVDEADMEMGTKQREEQEMQQILAEERRERSFQESVL